MPTAKITAKGQVTIPKKLRDAYGLEPGDTIHFEVREDGEIVLEPERRDVRELRGCVDTDAEGVSIEQMKEVVRRRGSET